MNNWKKGLKLILDITEHNKSQYPAMEIFIQELLQEVGDRVIGERAENSGMILESAGYRAGYNFKQREIKKTLQDYGVNS